MAETTQILFEITDDNLETGMRGYPCGYCVTSSVDPEQGLFYMGKPVSQMLGKSPEEIIFLLNHGHEPSAGELKAFVADINERTGLHPKTTQAITLLPRDGHPMKLFCAALHIAGMFEGTGDYQEDCLNIIAKLPLIAGIVINHHAGWGGIRSSTPAIGYMENFTRILNVPRSDLDQLTKIMRIFNILHYDHGGGNLSCFTGKAVASGLEDMYGALASAMSALAGPRHGKANQDCLHFVQEAVESLDEDPTQEQVEQYIQNKLDKKELIYGFGHAVLRVEDPRAAILYKIGEEFNADHPLIKMTKLLRVAGPNVLGKNPKISNPYPNVDAISGSVLTVAGFPYPQYYTVLFGLSRCIGIARQIVYERCEARDGKGTPIVRPKYLFKSRG